ncbi:cullin 1 [Strigomonas culicis]|uniref:Cullin 1 n=1 Tax=Strigomonas culicis TaxID=28005 RepID=S9U0E2_9TRYP|nr:cullin 1 [Strigomonas culicis]EPY24212.1 cullin 1 [Strigomonas culicis]|eukprot:EPY18666.1 cullin 1 [Strigomonas culicis]
MPTVTANGVTALAFHMPIEENYFYSFPSLWSAVDNACEEIFSFFNEPHQGDLTNVYNEINRNLCIIHTLVYRLTAYKCADPPTLVRGTAPRQITGDKPESTQVLAVFYLLKDILKKQLHIRKKYIQEPDIIGRYLDTYEQFSTSVNLIKTGFTYSQWVWQQRGLPAEHIVHPTELLALQLWTEIIVDSSLEKILREKVDGIVTAVRGGTIVSISAMEDIKRLSLNLSMLNGSRQTQYLAIMEEPYVNSLSAYYHNQKEIYKKIGAEKYIEFCVTEFKKEEKRVRFFLSKSSYARVRNEVFNILIGTEADFLVVSSQEWLREAVTGNPVHVKCLNKLYILLGSGTKPSWLERVVGDLVLTTAFEAITSRLSKNTMHEDVEKNNIIYEELSKVFSTFNQKIIKIFGAQCRLLEAIPDGIHLALQRLPSHCMYYTKTNEAHLLAIFASKEMEESRNIADGNWVADVYKKSTDKEQFHKCYKALLQQRLFRNMHIVQKKGIDDFLQREERMLSDLFAKGVNFDFAFSCNKMFKDLKESSTFNRYFGSTLPSVPVDGFVLSSSWDLSASRLAELPSARDVIYSKIKHVLSSYQKAYSNQMASRKISFLPQYSSFILNYKNPSGRNTKIHVYFGQARLAFVFNKQKKCTLTKLSEEADIQPAISKGFLAPFFSTNILKLNGTECSLGECSFDGDLLVLKPGVTNNTTKAQFPSTTTNNPARAENLHTFALEAIIVKFLKSVQEASLSDIQNAVQKALESYEFNVKQIKKSIERLIQRGYIIRGTADGTFAMSY